MSTVGWWHTMVLPSDVTPISTSLNPRNQNVIQIPTIVITTNTSDKGETVDEWFALTRVCMICPVPDWRS